MVRLLLGAVVDETGEDLGELLRTVVVDVRALLLGAKEVTLDIGVEEMTGSGSVLERLNVFGIA